MILTVRRRKQSLSFLLLIRVLSAFSTFGICCNT
jgi:hypothetical protein